MCGGPCFQVPDAKVCDGSLCPVPEVRALASLEGRKTQASAETVPKGSSQTPFGVVPEERGTSVSKGSSQSSSHLRDLKKGFPLLTFLPHGGSEAARRLRCEERASKGTSGT